jgi:phosphate uptake regulator
MSIAKDAERIGDYCKNVFEIGRFYNEPWGNSEFNEPLFGIQQRVDALFDATLEAFHQSDEKRAKALLDDVGDIKEQCSEIERALLHASHKYRTSEAVAYSLMARHYKRVAAHLGNICTAITGKVAQLGYLPDKRGGKQPEIESD